MASIKRSPKAITFLFNFDFLGARACPEPVEGGGFKGDGVCGGTNPRVCGGFAAGGPEFVEGGGGEIGGGGFKGEDGGGGPSPELAEGAAGGITGFIGLCPVFACPEFIEGAEGFFGSTHL